MSAIKKFISWTSTGLLLAILSGSPALADDTELLRVAPLPSDENKPRILFLIDTSGSMDAEEETLEQYVSTEAYSGQCDSDRTYWMKDDDLPKCGRPSNGDDDDDDEEDCDDNGNCISKRYVDKDNFFCDTALKQMAGLGSITTIFAQYRDGGPSGNESGPKKWQKLAAGYNSEPVECSSDSGIHGDGSSSTLVYAKAGNNIDPWYTANPAEEIDWAAIGGDQTYTFYDGNYLNWRVSAPVVQAERIDIVKNVLRTLFESISGIYVGVERFNSQEGGTIILGLVDIDQERNKALAAVDSLQAGGGTPLSEVMYESVLYWRGMTAEFAEEYNEQDAKTDPAILASAGPPQVYQAPELLECAKNFSVVLSDGAATNRDDRGPALTPTLPGFQAATGRTSCDNVNGTDWGECMDDISQYLLNTDIDPDPPGLGGDQYVTTHTVGFKTDTDNLRTTAERGGGKYYLADDALSLARAFQEIVSVVADRDLTFTSPAVAVNAFNRTQNLNDLYISLFKPAETLHWPGNIKKYKVVDGQITDASGNAAIDPATGFFKSNARSYWSTGVDGNIVTEGGAARQLPDPALRNLYTNNSGNDLTASANQLTPSNAGSFSDSDFGILSGGASIDDIIRWARGEDVADEDSNPTTTVRHAMGDPLHAQPAAVVYGGTAANPDVVVYTATNDGYLHAINASTGEELWSFVPKPLLKVFAALYENPEAKFKLYGLDGDVVPVVKDENDNGIVDGSDFVYLIFGMRRGGYDYYALDVTNKNSPQLLWNVQLTSGGQSWSSPVVAKVDINTPGTNADNAVVILGGGYDNVHDTVAHPDTPDGEGAGIHMLDLVSGAELWRAGADGAADLQLASMTRSIPTEIRVIDMSGDGYVDRMYASDLGGQLLRFDISNGSASGSLVAGGVIARFGGEGLTDPAVADTRRLYNTPDASLFQDRHENRRFIALSIGSGYRAHPLDNDTSDRFYSVRDGDVFNQLTQAEYNSYNIVTESDLVEVSGSVRTVIDPTEKGWMFTMPADQKVLASSVTFDDTVFFVGFSTEQNDTGGCAPSLGKNFLYRVSVENGDPVVTNLDTLDPADADDERMEELAQGGIAPTPTILFPSPDDPNCTGTDCAPPPIGCVGLECFDPGFGNNPVRTLWTQDGIQ